MWHVQHAVVDSGRLATSHRKICLYSRAVAVLLLAEWSTAATRESYSQLELFKMHLVSAAGCCDCLPAACACYAVVDVHYSAADNVACYSTEAHLQEHKCRDTAATPLPCPTACVSQLKRDNELRLERVKHQRVQKDLTNLRLMASNYKLDGIQQVLGGSEKVSWAHAVVMDVTHNKQVAMLHC